MLFRSGGHCYCRGHISWFTGGDSLDDGMDDRFCGEFNDEFGIKLLDNVFVNSDDV